MALKSPTLPTLAATRAVTRAAAVAAATAAAVATVVKTSLKKKKLTRYSRNSKKLNRCGVIVHKTPRSTSKRKLSKMLTSPLIYCEIGYLLPLESSSSSSPSFTNSHVYRVLYEIVRVIKEANKSFLEGNGEKALLTYAKSIGFFKTLHNEVNILYNSLPSAV